ncbi:hypothetical protein Desmer_4426 [Desulfosporosinus meridiei DSM 13257]|uniref:Uncharacterized protein n=1 Tax=Desulfosporosinus meridiei (strain ATCC BAA-275 / DSM 13257 / KCTC 12902 / NCIMB 13706 / S10) TaxID=768704 RepID=J7J4M5_DESMD|nr:hypothetical protein Desmer_4426 [Desulfosporosinus meridiei DSM 13257]
MASQNPEQGGFIDGYHFVRTGNRDDCPLSDRYDCRRFPGIPKKSLSGLKMDVSDEDFYEIATTLYDLISATRSKRFDLTEE